MKAMHGAALWLFCAHFSVFADTPINAWTNLFSGNWQDPSWSRGILPGPGQNIMLTNQRVESRFYWAKHGAKFSRQHERGLDQRVLTTGFIQRAAVELCRLRHATPGGAITVDTNAVLTVLGSMLSVTNSGTTNDELLVAGTVNQGDNSAVRATYLYLGPNQPNLAQVGVGTYNLTNGLLNVSTGYMKVSGTLNQYGGYSWFDQLTLYIGGYYYLNDGDFGGNIFIDGGNFYQFGVFLMPDRS